jgi:hypothetical protein
MLMVSRKKAQKARNDHDPGSLMHTDNEEQVEFGAGFNR